MLYFFEFQLYMKYLWLFQFPHKEFHLLDLFSVAGGMRYRSPGDQIRLFEKAYIENPELAMKLLFYIRDVRQGMS